MEIAQARQFLEFAINWAGYDIEYRKSLTGRVWWRSKRCQIPQAKTRKSLYIVAHELYHCMFPRQGEKVYINEMKAERFAHGVLRGLGFAVPRSVTQGAKNYVSWKVIKAQRRGLKRIDSNVKQWLKQ